MTKNEIQHIGFLIFPGFPMACLTSMIEPLRAANEIAGQNAFRWSLIGETKTRVISSANVGFETNLGLTDIDDVDLLFFLSSPTTGFATPAAGNGALRTLARHGMALGGISGGVFPLVRTGLMAGHPVSVHWCYEAAFRAEFPDIDASSDVIVTGERRYTASGAGAGFDLALMLIEDRLDEEIAHEVACWFQHPSMRGAGVKQRIPVALHPKTGDKLPDLVARSVSIFSERMEDPISIAELADRMQVTPRQIERAFKGATAQSPTHYYRSMRMKAARQLVLYSKDPIGDIAAAVGYSSAAPLVAHYRSAYGKTPHEDRRQINHFRVESNSPVPSLQG